MILGGINGLSINGLSINGVSINGLVSSRNRRAYQQKKGA